jgi:hypothetical protein
MVILRPTRRLRSLLPVTETPLLASDTALGDWYVNRITVDRQPLLLVVSSVALLPILTRARDVRGLPGRLAGLVGARLSRCGVDDRTIAAETLAMTTVAIAPTVDRSVLGVMVDFAKMAPYHLEPGRWDEATLEMVEERLAQTPCRTSRSSDRVVFPDREVLTVLRAKWSASAPLPPGGAAGRVH